MNSKPSKIPIVLISPLLKFGGEVALQLLKSTDSDIILMLPSYTDIETLRSQLPDEMRSRIIPRELNMHSGSSVRLAIYWLKIQYKKIKIILHLMPHIETKSKSFYKNRFNSLLYSNDRCVEILKKDLENYFGKQLNYIQYDFELNEDPTNIALKAICD